MTNPSKNYDWKRFWCPRDGSINLVDGGYLADPEGPYGEHHNPALRTFGAVSHLPCLALLGEPGIGKTKTMEVERGAIDAAVSAEGGKTLWLDLRSCGSEGRIASKLFESPEFTLWLEGDYHLHLFLDSLDECLLRVETVAAMLVDELRNCPIERLSIRIGCRTAEWPTSLLESGLKDLWGEEGFGAYELAPLRRNDVAAAAAANGIDPEAFMDAVHEAEVVPLAIKPVTLAFLMDSYRATGEFPANQADLYLEGCRWLCEERNTSRVSSGRTGGLDPDQRLAVAARVAAVTVFSNKYAVWIGVQQAVPEKEDVLVRALAGGTEFVGEDEFPVGEDAVSEVLRTGLFSARGPERMGWAHQTYAEFLAARYLAQRNVHADKIMSLLVHPDDEEARLIPQLHEAAGWLASMSSEVFRAVMGAEPEVLLRSDVASTGVEGKTALVDALLKLYEEERLLPVGWASQARYEKLNHPGIAGQLRPYLLDTSKGFVVRRVALEIAEACELRSLQGDAADVALDASQELLVRKEAAHFVARVGDGPTRARLMPLAIGKADDPDDDLKGNGLRAVWPDHITAQGLFAALTPPKEARYTGSYELFLTNDLADRLSTADLPVALAWVENRGASYEEPFRFGELADQIMQRAWVELPNPGVASAFAGAALARLRRYEEVVEERSGVLAATNEPPFSERVATDDHRRRLLLQEMIGLLEAHKDDTFLLVTWKLPLVLKEDVGWLVEMLRSEASERKKGTLAALVGQTSHLWDDERYELVYLAHLEDPKLASEVGRFFAPVELGSEEAETQRRYHEMSSGREVDEEDPQSPDPPIARRVTNGLDTFEAGDVEAFWTDVYHFMQYDARGYGSVSEVE